MSGVLCGARWSESRCVSSWPSTPCSADGPRHLGAVAVALPSPFYALGVTPVLEQHVEDQGAHEEHQDDGDHCAVASSSSASWRSCSALAWCASAARRLRLATPSFHS